MLSLRENLYWESGLQIVDLDRWPNAWLNLLTLSLTKSVDKMVDSIWLTNSKKFEDENSILNSRRNVKSSDFGIYSREYN